MLTNGSYDAVARIGIVACSSEGAALCYRTICAQAPAMLGPHAPPDIVLVSPSLASYMERIDRGDWNGVAEILLEAADKLAMSGADFLICPDNTVHRALPHIADRLPLPWLHIADAVVEDAGIRGFRKLGIMGTRWLVESDVYPQRIRSQQMAYALPDPAMRERMNGIIMDELVNAVFKDESAAALQEIVEGFKRQDCDAVVLGCTELPLVLDDSNSALPVLDSTRLLARAALRRAAALNAG